MSKSFIKTENGLEQVAKPLVKVYDTMDDFLTALPNLEENEIVTTEFTGGTEDVMLNFEELRGEINDIKKVIPSDAAEDNQLVTESEIAGGLEERVEAIENVIPSGTSTTNKLLNHDDVFNNSDPNSLSSKVSSLESDMTQAQSDIGDNTTAIGANATAITNIQNVIDSTASAVNQVLSASSVNALIPTFTLSGTTLTITLPA